MNATDLVSLAAVKSWLNISSNREDVLLGRMITQVSRVVLNYINRSMVLPVTVTESYDGNGKDWIQLRSWPAISVISVIIGTQTVPQAAGQGQPGWSLEPSDDDPPGHMQRLSLTGYMFWKGIGNVLVTYRCGYQITDESATIDASSYTATPAAVCGDWASDVGVTFASGAALTKVSASPSAGQYMWDADNLRYQFSAADAGKQVLLTYGYIPADLAMATIEWIGERYRYKDRIGQTSKSLGGQETVSFTKDQVPVFVAQGLQNFRRVTPC